MRSGFFHWEMMWKATLGVEGGREERERTKRERERGWKRSYKRCAIYLSIHRSSEKGPQKSESIELVHPAHDVGLAVTAAGGLVPGASFVPEPSERLQMTSLRCLEGGVLVPSAPLPPQVLEHPQVTSTSGDSAGLEFFHRAPFVPGPLQAFQMTELGCQLTCEVTPQASLTLSPLQAFQVTFLSGPVACVFIPRAALAPEPLQNLQVTTLSCTAACVYIPRAALAPEPLQGLQMTTLSCPGRSTIIPGAALAPEPLQPLQVTTFAGFSKEPLILAKEPLIQPVLLLGFQPLQGPHLASARCEEDKERRKSEPRTPRDSGKEDSPAFPAIALPSPPFLKSPSLKRFKSSHSRGRWP